jgi:hypothetical protein
LCRRKNAEILAAAFLNTCSGAQNTTRKAWLEDSDDDDDDDNDDDDGDARPTMPPPTIPNAHPGRTEDILEVS